MNECIILHRTASGKELFRVTLEICALLTLSKEGNLTLCLKGSWFKSIASGPRTGADGILLWFLRLREDKPKAKPACASQGISSLWLARRAAATDVKLSPVQSGSGFGSNSRKGPARQKFEGGLMGRVEVLSWVRAPSLPRPTCTLLWNKLFHTPG